MDKRVSSSTRRPQVDAARYDVWAAVVSQGVTDMEERTYGLVRIVVSPVRGCLSRNFNWAPNARKGVHEEGTNEDSDNRIVG